jgi:hypothetical protein
MGTPYIPPNDVVNPQQQQHQFQSARAGDLFNEDNSSVFNESQSSSRSEVIQSPINSQTNITNNNSDYFGFGVGITRPVPTGSFYFNRDEWSNSTVYGAQFNFPIGGKTSKLSNEFINQKVRTIKLANAASEFSFCNSLFTQGIAIDYSMLPLDHPAHQCDGLIISKRVVAQVPIDHTPVIDDLKSQLQQTIEMNRKLQVRIQKMQVRLEQQHQKNPFVADDDG